MKELKELYRFDGNDKVILLNTNNFHWIRMKKKEYEDYTSSLMKRKNFENFIEEKYQLLSDSVQESGIRSVYYSITGRCNMNCAFCTMNSGPNVSMEHDLSLNEITNMLIPKLEKLNLKKVVITGGEPLVRKDINEILKCFSEAFEKERIILQTNGLLLTEEIIMKISDKIGLLEISIENIFGNPNLLERMKKIFQCAGKQRINLSFSFVVDSESKKYLEDAIEICHDYNAALTVRIVSMVGRAKENNADDPILEAYETLKIQYEIVHYLLEKNYLEDNLTNNYDGILQPKRNCGAFGKILAIHPDGTTYMCGNFKNSNFSMGNIRTMSMDSICEDLNSKKESSIYQNIFYVNKNEMCKDCHIKYICCGPCIAEMAENSADYTSMKAKCVSAKIMLEYAMFYFERNRTREENLRGLESYIKEYLDGKRKL